MGGSLGPSLATSRVPVAAVDAPEDFGFWMPGRVGAAGRSWPPNAFSDVGRVRKASRDPAVAQAARGRRVRRRRAQRAGAARQRRRTDLHAARRLSAEPRKRFPSRLAGLAAMLGAGLPIRCATLNAPGRVGHPRRPGRPPSPDNLRIHRRQPVRVPARPRGARARRARADARMVGVRPPRRRRTESGTDHGAAGIGFVIGTRATGPGGRVPGPATLDPAGQPARDVGLPRPLRGAVRGTGSASTPARCCPAAAGSRGRRFVR